MRKIMSGIVPAMLLIGCNNHEAPSESVPRVQYVGAMRNVMHKGELFGSVALDTISDKNHLYGLGPLEYLGGEIMIIDGKCYISKVGSDTSMIITEDFSVKAPFFVYANVDKWYEAPLPDSIHSIPQLETFLDAITKNKTRPFFFRINGKVDSADIHIVNLLAGTIVRSPEDAHQNQETYSLLNKTVELIGVFSTEHAGVFTHHDSYVHIHLITENKDQMGHLESLSLAKGSARLYLPYLVDN